MTIVECHRLVCTTGGHNKDYFIVHRSGLEVNGARIHMVTGSYGRIDGAHTLVRKYNGRSRNTAADHVQELFSEKIAKGYTIDDTYTIGDGGPAPVYNAQDGTFRFEAAPAPELDGVDFGESANLTMGSQPLPVATRTAKTKRTRNRTTPKESVDFGDNLPRRIYI